MKKLSYALLITLSFGLLFTSVSIAHKAGCKCECVCPEDDRKTSVEPATMQEAVGVVTAKGVNAINVQSDVDGTLYKLWSDDPSLISGLELGYRVKVSFIGNTVQSVKTLGIPVEAEPTMIRIN